jgi:casein kinase II subunit alpha
VLKPVAAKKIKREIKVLRNLTGGPNVVALLDVVRDREFHYIVGLNTTPNVIVDFVDCLTTASGRYHSLIMEYVENVDWKQLFPRLTEVDIKHYTFQLLKVNVNRPHPFLVSSTISFEGSRFRSFTWGDASRRETGKCHDWLSTAKGIVIASRPYENLTWRSKLKLIDWGLAEFYHPGTEYHIRVGSRYYKAPELLVGYKQYDYSLDMWSVGCMFASMVSKISYRMPRLDPDQQQIFRREHFFRGSDNNDQLLKIMKTLGTEQFDVYLKTYGINFETEMEALLKKLVDLIQIWLRPTDASLQLYKTTLVTFYYIGQSTAGLPRVYGSSGQTA